MPVLAPLFKVFGKKLVSTGKSSSNPYAHTGSHNMQIFSNSKSQHHTTTSNINTLTTSRKERAARAAARYPGDVSDNESQETILGKAGEEGSIARERSVDERSGVESPRRERDLESAMGGARGQGNEVEGIMMTVQVDVSSEARDVHAGKLEGERNR